MRIQTIFTYGEGSLDLSYTALSSFDVCPAFLLEARGVFVGLGPFLIPHFSFAMETRVALIGIIVEEPSSVAPLNALLHEYSAYVIGRMGIPYKPRNISVISVTLDAPQDVISSLSGKLGMLPGVTAKALMTKVRE